MPIPLDLSPVRISLRKRPVLRDRVFGLAVGAALLHGSIILCVFFFGFFEQASRPCSFVVQYDLSYASIMLCLSLLSRLLPCYPFTGRDFTIKKAGHKSCHSTDKAALAYLLGQRVRTHSATS